MKIAIGSDHAGYGLKESVRALLQDLGHVVDDRGTHAPAPSVDYPDYAEAVARSVAAGQADRGVLVCGTGIGMCMTANKISGVRAALCHDHYTARVSREHNDANVLCLGGRTTGLEVALEIVRTFLETPFAADRHAARVDKIRRLEGKERGR